MEIVTIVWGYKILSAIKSIHLVPTQCACVVLNKNPLANHFFFQVARRVEMNDSNDTISTEEFEFEEVDLWLRVLHVLILLLLLLASLLGNSVVLLLVFCNKSLQYRSVLCSLGLVVADMVIVLSWSLTGIGSASAGKFPFQEEGCSILGLILNVAVYARWCTVALITLERFCNILFPFFYLKWSKPLLIVLVILSWLIPLATTSPWMAGVGEYIFRIRFSSCTIFCGPDRACFLFYITLYGTYVVIGGLLPMILYLSLCIIGQRKHYRMKHIAMGTFDCTTDPESQNAETTNNSGTKGKLEGSASSNRQETSSIPRTGSSSSSSSSNNSSNSTTSSNSSSLGYNSKSGSDSSSGAKKKILVTFFMIFINVFLTQLPIYITSALRSQQKIYNSIPLWLRFIFVYIYLLGSVLDPLLIIRNTDFRDSIKKFLRRKVANTQSENVRSVLLDFAKMSSFLEMPPSTSRRNTRRFSCPSTTIQKRATMSPPAITKARSFDGYVYSEQETGFRVPMTLPNLILSTHRETTTTQSQSEVAKGEEIITTLDGPRLHILKETQET